jgi:hypothetical protein
MLPTAADWTMIIGKWQDGLFHTEYDQRDEIVRLPLKKRALDAPVDQLTFSVRSQPPGGAVVMAWETTEVSLPFVVEK